MTPFQQNLAKRIQDSGPLPFGEVMLLSNEHYYAHHHVFGEHGDFITAPEISQIFGELLGIWCVVQAEALGIKNPVVVELGPGRGFLMADMMRVFEKVSNFTPEIVLVESSERLTQAQQKVLAHSPFPITWQRDLGALPKGLCLFIANEFLDALPVDVHAMNDGISAKMLVYWSANAGFTFSHDPETGIVLERSSAAEGVVGRVADHIAEHGGAALFIDYGDYIPESRTGLTVQAVKNHRYVDPLTHLGESDITFHIDFYRMQKACLREGISTLFSTQREFLKTYGFDQRLEALIAFCASDEEKQDVLSRAQRLIDPTQMGELFKVLEIKTAS